LRQDKNDGDIEYPGRQRDRVTAGDPADNGPALDAQIIAGAAESGQSGDMARYGQCRRFGPPDMYSVAAEPAGDLVEQRLFVL
jgi:hypothetical protein